MKELIDQILKLKGRREVEAFLRGILTPQELEQLVTRLQVVVLLKKGVSQRGIAQKLGIGIATVSRGSREIKMGRFAEV